MTGHTHKSVDKVKLENDRHGTMMLTLQNHHQRKDAT